MSRQLAPETDFDPGQSGYGDSLYSFHSEMLASSYAPSSPARRAGKVLLKRLDHPCLSTLPNFSSYFDKLPLRERYPPFSRLTPREKTAKSPRTPGALHQMFREPDISHDHRKRWLSHLPLHEQLLRHQLDQKLPGSPTAPCSARSAASEPVPPDVLKRHRKEHAAKLETLIRKVAPSKDVDAPLIVAARRRLQRLREPEENRSLRELCSRVSSHSEDEIASVCISLDATQRGRIQAALDAQLAAVVEPFRAGSGQVEDALRSWQSQDGDY